MSHSERSHEDRYMNGDYDDEPVICHSTDDDDKLQRSSDK